MIKKNKIKVLPEYETRVRILKFAREIGCEKEVKLTLEKYDKLLRNCANQKERDDISKLGIYEIYRLLGGGGELYVNEQLIAKED